MTGRRIVVVLTARRIGSLVIDLRQLDRLGVDPSCMSAAMLDVDGMVCAHCVQLGKAERSTFCCLGVVVFEAEHPLARRRLRCPLAKRFQNVSNRPKIAIHHTQMRETGLCWMRMRVNEARQYSLAAEIDFLCRPTGQCQHLVIRSDGQKSSAGNRYRLRPRLSRIDGPEVSVKKDHLRFDTIHGKQREKSQCTQPKNKLA